MPIFIPKITKCVARQILDSRGMATVEVEISAGELDVITAKASVPSGKSTGSGEAFAIRYIVGIDEAGRGPLAGPVAVGAFCVRADSRAFRKFCVGVKDSKKLSEKKREEWFMKIESGKKLGNISFAVTFASNDMIDRRGLAFAIRHALAQSLKKLSCPPNETLVLLDGGLHAPEEYIYQETIIKGDEKEPVISLASIAAKVLRDRKMVALAKRHPQYGFDKHKGYGTAVHYEAIARFGVLEIHRKSFLKLAPPPATYAMLHQDCLKA